ncbi:SprT-like domain-containing protein [Polluticaenibacter yanchengensis]|uniref:SprT-like domain-containing protein n=1 Tax=Polluticaenibacter yanchengensis TaxID=3014562 RepID=A0ABT4ULK8_9BACT|nr:SprT-like domain-containing protein [Chitinophagaceae bacterium LY-5]
MEKQRSFEPLRQYLPDNCFELVMPLILKHKVHLTISRGRKTKLGDYRNAYGNNNHRISVNGDLNKYAFLVTLIHELAHLLTYEKFGHRVQPHGTEWKSIYSQMLYEFIQHQVLPVDITEALVKTIKKPGASTCSEVDLQRVLNKYDKRHPAMTTVETINIGDTFALPDGRKFVRGEVIRKRIKCFLLPGMQPYSFTALYEVIDLNKLNKEIV